MHYHQAIACNVNIDSSLLACVDDEPLCFDIESSNQERAVRVRCDSLSAKKAWLKMLPVHYPERQRLKIKLVL
jgi:hypothetical protein